MMGRMRTGPVMLVLAILVLAAAGMPGPVYAHWADQAVAEIIVGPQDAQITLTFPTGLAAFADANRDGRIDPGELRAQQTEVQRFFKQRVRLQGTAAPERGAPGASGRPIPGALRIASAAPLQRGAAGVSELTHSTVLLTYSWPQPVRSIRIRYDLFLPAVPTASCLATIIQGGEVRSSVFTPEHRDAFIALDHAAPPSHIAGFIGLGVRHILSGYDHLLFLLSLLLAGGALMPQIKIVTAFTAAHSITLSLASLGLIALPARWVESAIALSIAYVAAENLWRRRVDLRQRWGITFGFGLVHGLGFASVLQGLALPRAALATSLVGFNLGVELGQLAVVVVAVAGLSILRAWPGEIGLRRWVSAAAVVAGVLWFVQRAFFGA